LFIWDGVFFVHQGYYSGSILKFKLTFPDAYPERPPAVHFITDVFHPLINQRDGSFSLAPRFGTSGWRSKECHVFDVLHWIKAAFKKHALDELKDKDCLNKEAFNLYRDNTSSFAALATQSSTLSQSHSALFDRDHPSMVSKVPPDAAEFKELTAEELGKLRDQLELEVWDLGRIQ